MGRILGQALSFTAMVILALAPAAAAMALACLVSAGRLAVALLVGVSLGAFVAWRFRAHRARVAGRPKPGPDVPEREPATVRQIVSPAMVQVTDALLDFHDFDRVKNRFEHWTIGERGSPLKQRGS